MRHILALAMLAFAIACGQEHTATEKVSAPVDQAQALPPAGVKFELLPDGDGKAIAESRCLPCHSSEMIRQQRLNEKQWAAELDKMTRWGSDLRAEERPALLAYFVRNFGPENRYTPIETLPIDLQ